MRASNRRSIMTTEDPIEGVSIMTAPTTAYATAAAVFVAGLLEGIGIPWPGAVIVAGAAAGLGGGYRDVPLAAMLFAAGYCLGSMIQYVMGRLVGQRMLAWLPAKQRCSLEALTTRYGSAVVLWTRPLAAGNYVSIPAGMMRMPVLRFQLYTFLGIAPWAAGMAAAGWLLGGQVEAVGALLGRWLVPGVVAFAAAVVLAKLTGYAINAGRSARHEARHARVSAVSGSM